MFAIFWSEKLAKNAHYCIWYSSSSGLLFSFLSAWEKKKNHKRVCKGQAMFGFSQGFQMFKNKIQGETDFLEKY